MTASVVTDNFEWWRFALWRRMIRLLLAMFDAYFLSDALGVHWVLEDLGDLKWNVIHITSGLWERCHDLVKSRVTIREKRVLACFWALCSAKTEIVEELSVNLPEVRHKKAQIIKPWAPAAPAARYFKTSQKSGTYRGAKPSLHKIAAASAPFSLVTMLGKSLPSCTSPLQSWLPMCWAATALAKLILASESAVTTVSEATTVTNQLWERSLTFQHFSSNL